MRSLGNFIPTALTRKAASLNRLNQCLLDCLPTELIGHVQIASFNKAELVLVTHSPVWASKLRYRADEVKRQLSTKTGKVIKSVSISIHPGTAPLPAKKHKRPSLSMQSALQIKALADSVEDPSLKSTLGKLAKRAR